MDIFYLQTQGTECKNMHVLYIANHKEKSWYGYKKWPSIYEDIAIYGWAWKEVDSNRANYTSWYVNSSLVTYFVIWTRFETDFHGKLYQVHIHTTIIIIHKVQIWRTKSCTYIAIHIFKPTTKQVHIHTTSYWPPTMQPQ